MTNRELFQKFGSTPVLIDTGPQLIEVIYLSETLRYRRIIQGLHLGQNEVLNDTDFDPDHDWAIDALVDYFEESNTSTVCSCDTSSVLMVTGCRCGALEREKK